MRAKQLLDAGAMSQQEFEQAETNLNTAKAALEALKAREREAGVELQYFRVTSPTGGVVGDIPVRVGDRVTTSTVLTTVDQQAGLEAYVQIPIERAPDVRIGLPVRLMDAQGAVLAETAIDFVSPQVDDRTQSVLVKAPVPANQGYPHRAVRAGARRLAQRAWPDGADHRRHAHQRAVFRVCRRTGRARVRRTPARGEGRRAARQRVRPPRGPQGRRPAHRVRRAESRRRRARRAAGLGAHDVRRRLHPPADPLVGPGAGHHPGRRDRDSDAAHRAISGAGAAAGHGQQLLHRRQRTDGRNALSPSRSNRPSTASKACST